MRWKKLFCRPEVHELVTRSSHLSESSSDCDSEMYGETLLEMESVGRGTSLPRNIRRGLADNKASVKEKLGICSGKEASSSPAGINHKSNCDSKTGIDYTITQSPADSSVSHLTDESSARTSSCSSILHATNGGGPHESSTGFPVSCVNSDVSIPLSILPKSAQRGDGENLIGSSIDVLHQSKIVHDVSTDPSIKIIYCFISSLFPQLKR